MLPDFITDLSNTSEISLEETVFTPQNICEKNNDFELPDIVSTPNEHFHFFDLNLSQQKLDVINNLKWSTEIGLGYDKNTIIKALNTADPDNKIYAEEAVDIIYHISNTVETQLKKLLNRQATHCNTVLFTQSERADDELDWHVDGLCGMINVQLKIGEVL